jgi:nicotinamidase-related amidase
MRHIDYEMESIELERNELERIRIGIGKKNNDEITKALYMIDMNNGFVNFGPMSNPKYNDLVPEQLKMIKKFERENELINYILEGHDKNAVEFNSYPAHCIRFTDEAKLIPEFDAEKNYQNAKIYYKNSINGMLNRNLQDQIRELKNLKEVVFEGVCADLCVMDFARTYARYLDEINKSAKLFVVKKAIDTFDSENHNRDEWMDIALKVMASAGIEVVEDINELEEKEKTLGLK